MRIDRIVGRFALACAMSAPAVALHAQSYPARPIRLIVPYPPGAGTDIIARTVGQKLGEVLGQQIVVDNRGGGGGVIGADAGAKAPPDGYTMVLVTSTFAMTPALQKPPYDPVRDFTPLILLAAVPNILVIHPALPAHSLQELIALARARPGELSYATSGTGTVSHLLTEWLCSMVGGVKLVHVPYKGNAQALTDLLGGHVSIMFSALPSAMPYLVSGVVTQTGIPWHLQIAPDSDNNLLDPIAALPMDSCWGHPYQKQYHYHGYSWKCFPNQGDPNEHSPLFGYAIDGFGVYGPRGEKGVLLTNDDLDECHGHTHAIEWDGETKVMYHYHVNNEYPYTMGCYRGKPVELPAHLQHATMHGFLTRHQTSAAESAR